MKIITCTDGKKLRRISRWIKLQCNWHPTNRNSLWDYACDGYKKMFREYYGY